MSINKYKNTDQKSQKYEISAPFLGGNRAVDLAVYSSA